MRGCREPVVSLTRQRSEEEALLADAVGLALLVVLETLSPARAARVRAARMFGVPFDEIAADRRPLPGGDPAAGQPGPAAGPGRRDDAEPISPVSATSWTRSSRPREPAISRRCCGARSRCGLPRRRRRERPLAPPLLVGAQAVCRQIARQGPRYIPTANRPWSTAPPASWHACRPAEAARSSASPSPAAGSPRST